MLFDAKNRSRSFVVACRQSQTIGSISAAAAAAAAADRVLIDISVVSQVI